MNIESYKHFDPVEWNNIILELNGNPLHLPDILLLDASPENFTYLVFKNNGFVKLVGKEIGRR